MNKKINLYYKFSFVFSIFIGSIYFFVIQKELVGFFIYSVLAPLLLLFPIFLKKIKTITQNYNENLFIIIKISLASIIYIHGIGSLYLYQKPFEYDQIAHFATLFIITLLLMLFLEIINTKPFSKEKGSMFLKFLAIFVFGFLGGLINEIIQFLSDQTFGSKMFFDSDQTIKEDAITDIRANILGIIFGLLFLKIKWKNIKKTILKNLR